MNDGIQFDNITANATFENAPTQIWSINLEKLAEISIVNTTKGEFKHNSM